MSPRILGPCTYPGCPGRADAGHGRCQTHARQARIVYDRARPSARERGYDGAWRAIRAEVLARQPVCAEPGCGEPSRDVDHEPRYVPGTDHRGYRLTGYCHRHHSARTSRQVR